MSYVLIDNSTLTSVQRLLGEIEINNKNIIDGDILATENLIQSILFYDEIITIDDYKEEFRESRKKRFDFIRFLSADNFDFNDLQVEAQKEAKSYTPEIRGGEFVDEDFKNVLELLKLNIVTTWNISSSEYYLNLKLLGYKDDSENWKYNSIASAMLEDFFDRDSKADYSATLLDTYGKPIKRGYKVPNAKWSNGGKTNDKLLTGQLWSFIASLNWIAYKSIYYTHVAQYFQSDLFLHPIRQSFNIHYMNKIQNFDDNLVQNLLNELKDDSLETIKIIKQSMQPSLETLSLPYFSFWLIHETKDSKHIIEKAYDIRGRQSFIDAREQIAELNNLVYEEHDLTKFSKKSQDIKKHMNKTFEKIKSTYGIQTNQGINFNNMVKIFNSTFGASIPLVFDKKVELPEFLQTKPKGLGMVYRDITEDLSKVSKFGKYKDMITSNINLKPYGERFDLGLHHEAPEYRYFSSQYKSPM
ncbi:hypothetical protein LCX93_00920 [Sulfurimonas sp. SWIR-19]|uniref:hypothetical protein n=1 Tax=Sulfurimonas sp. SWIR-19 TaxID=2878390 RepID=UPI001CF304A3|nr:hypothetical protein [Sulfurimonas sp. SWIR-19]UCN00510.1 hypothetical protein LCX93_00920 [Sulfurimonas sp. SWIR-19]